MIEFRCDQRDVSHCCSGKSSVILGNTNAFTEYELFEENLGWKTNDVANCAVATGAADRPTTSATFRVFLSPRS